jgi:type IV pilus assembly protein PilA
VREFIQCRVANVASSQFGEKNMKKTTQIVTLGVVLLLITGCSPDLSESILGSWKDVSSDEYIEFFEDGTLTIQADRGPGSGTYTLLEDQRIIVELGGLYALAGPLIMRVNVEDDVLTFTDTKGDVDVFRRYDAQTRTVSPSENPAMASIRDQVSEGLNLTAGGKAAVTEYYQDRGSMPTNNAMAGLEDASEIRGTYVVSVEVDSGVITATFGKDAHPEINGRTLQMTPDASQGYVSWACSSRDIKPEYLPTACR